MMEYTDSSELIWERMSDLELMNELDEAFKPIQWPPDANTWNCGTQDGYAQNHADYQDILMDEARERGLDPDKCNQARRNAASLGWMAFVSHYDNDPTWYFSARSFQEARDRADRRCPGGAKVVSRIG